MIFCEKIGCKIIRQNEIQLGKNLLIELNSDSCIITLFDNGNVRIQGKDSNLKNMFLMWNNKLKSLDDGYREGQADLVSSWRDWGEESKWLLNFIEMNGMQPEDKLPVDFLITREILFHDYMFRNRSLDLIDQELLGRIITNWFNRYWFMNINLKEFLQDFFDVLKSNIGEDTPSIGDIALPLAYTFCTHCPNKFINIDGNSVCPQTKECQNDCLIDLMDAIFPYNKNGQILSFTKGNFDYLVHGKGKIGYKSIKATTPIEEIMENSLKQAGILTLPQYQAFDNNHKYKIDFIVKTQSGLSLAVECDGLEFHARKDNYIRDRIRDRYLQERGFYLMRFSSVEIFNEIERCIEEIDRIFWKIQKGEINRPGFNKISYFGYSDYKI